MAYFLLLTFVLISFLYSKLVYYIISIFNYISFFYIYLYSTFEFLFKIESNSDISAIEENKLGKLGDVEMTVLEARNYFNAKKIMYKPNENKSSKEFQELANGFFRLKVI